MNNAKRLEWEHRRENRQYDENLKVKGNYYKNKRADQQKFVYTDEEIKAAVETPSAENFAEEVRLNSKARERFFEQLFYIAQTDRERDGATGEKEKAGHKVRMMTRLLIKIGECLRWNNQDMKI